MFLAWRPGPWRRCDGEPGEAAAQPRSRPRQELVFIGQRGWDPHAIATLLDLCLLQGPELHLLDGTERVADPFAAWPGEDAPPPPLDELF
jgi:hypothetical protein